VVPLLSFPRFRACPRSLTPGIHPAGLIDQFPAPPLCRPCVVDPFCCARKFPPLPVLSLTPWCHLLALSSFRPSPDRFPHVRGLVWHSVSAFRPTCPVSLPGHSPASSPGLLVSETPRRFRASCRTSFDSTPLRLSPGCSPFQQRCTVLFWSNVFFFPTVHFSPPPVFAYFRGLRPSSPWRLDPGHPRHFPRYFHLYVRRFCSLLLSPSIL